MEELTVCIRGFSSINNIPQTVAGVFYRRWLDQRSTIKTKEEVYLEKLAEINSMKLSSKEKLELALEYGLPKFYIGPGTGRKFSLREYPYTNNIGYTRRKQ